MITLGIESSCDETSICILSNRKILAMKTHTQIDLHKAYGGVVPEIASRDHLARISHICDCVMDECGVGYHEIDLIAYTSEPGLIGSLLTGIMFAKGLSLCLEVPSIAVNHIHGHIFTCGLTHGIYEDFLCLLFSGGHTAIYRVTNFQNIHRVGSSIDDSLGEVFDKLSKALGFGYPGGPVIEELALYGDCDAYKFKIPLKGRSDFDFSLSGIKTEFLKVIQSFGDIPPHEDILRELKNVPRGTSTALKVADVCASFQKTIAIIVLDRLKNVVRHGNFCDKKIVLCGGVASNEFIRGKVLSFCVENDMEFYVPDRSLCTDNAAMIANVGALMFRKN